MPATLPPYAVATPVFRFRHLASLAGRAPIGGAREVALACFVAARLAADSVDGMLSGGDLSERVARSAGARGWLGTLSLPSGVKAPATLSAEISAAGTPAAVGRALAGLALSATSYLDPASRAELDALAGALTR